MTKYTAKALLYIAFTLILMTGCNIKQTQKSFITSLDEIDALIKQEQYKEAVNSLKTLEKSAHNSWNALSIYRRYQSLGEEERGKRILKKSLKKNPQNTQLAAVYSMVLLQEGNLTEAVKEAKCLQGTKYGSIYSEALLKESAKTLEQTEDKGLSSYISESYLPIYLDAYKSSEKPFYLQNAALIHLAKGEYVEAFNIRPQSVKTSDEGLFWASVCYDNKCYADAINYLDEAVALSKSERQKVQLLSLQTDSYTALGENEQAQQLRKTFIDSLQFEDGKWVLPYEAENERESEVFSAIFTNAARFAFDKNDYNGCHEYITFAVNKWPLFTPALSLYADFAYQSNLEREENIIQRQIRNAGVTTVEMEEFDSRPKIPLTDAAARIDNALKETNNPILYVLALDLKYKTDTTLTDDDKCRDVWNILERNIVAPGIYPEELFDYAVNFLITHKKRSDAWFLYKSSMSKRLHIDLDNDNNIPNPDANPLINPVNVKFFETLMQNASLVSEELLEYGAYFATSLGFRDIAIRMYQIICEESYHPTNYAFINMALVYSSTGQKEQARDTLEKTVGRCTNMKQKSLVMYRIALLYYTSGDALNAKRSAEYAVTLNPRNADARLLLSRLKG